MKQKAKEFLKHPLIEGSTIIFLGTLFGNVFNFLYTIFMLRLLPSGDKGVLFALISIITLPSLAANAITPSIVTFAGSYFAKKDLQHVHGLYSKILKVYLASGMLFFLIFLLFIPFLSEFFKISNHQLLLLANVIIFINFFNTINSGFLQAKLAFGFISFINILNPILKLVSGILLVMLGFAVGGAVVAIVVSALISFIFTFVPLKFVFNKNAKKESVSTRELIIYGLPSAIIILGSTSLITTDILLVKHFFHPFQADFYAGISIIGRVIFYFSSPIAIVMFPLIVQKTSKNESNKGIFILSIFLVLLPSIVITAAYFLFPNLIMNVFGVKNINPGHWFLLGMFGIFISIYSVGSVLINYYLSIKKTNIYVPIIVSVAIQIIGIWFYHESFLSVIIISIIAVLLLVISLLLYYPHATKKQ